MSELKLIPVPRPKWASRWPDGKVAVGPRRPLGYCDGYRQDVYLEGEKVGTIESTIWTPYTVHKRLRYDQKPRRGYQPADSTRIHHDTRWQAIRDVLDEVGK